MSICPSNISYSDVLGEFKHAETGAVFDYIKTDNSWPGLGNLFPHLIFTCDGVRHANVKKTVAYIVVDEDAYGNAVSEKWDIRHNWKIA